MPWKRKEASRGIDWERYSGGQVVVLNGVIKMGLTLVTFEMRLERSEGEALQVILEKSFQDRERPV